MFYYQELNENKRVFVHWYKETDEGGHMSEAVSSGRPFCSLAISYPAIPDAILIPVLYSPQWSQNPGSRVSCSAQIFPIIQNLESAAQLKSFL
jgi:hypothetical protein